jgi:hypothetical protein
VLLAMLPYRVPAVASSVVAGVGWLFCLSTLNVASQEVLPSWVRARGLALYLTALSAGIALGSALWGTLAGWTDVRWAWGCGAAALLVSLALAYRWRFDRIDDVDLRPAPMNAPEATRVGAEDADSPTLVVVAYEVRTDAEEDFLRALRRVGRVRRRTGASDWSVYRDADRGHRYVETFVLPSWDEHVRQHQRRTVTDFELQEDVRRFLKPGTEPTARHFVAPPEPTARFRQH